MAITAQMVKELREKTGVGMMDCKTALNETSGDMEAAVDWLRTKGLAKAAKKAGRVAVGDAHSSLGVIFEAGGGGAFGGWSALASESAWLAHHAVGVVCTTRLGSESWLVVPMGFPSLSITW